MKPLWSAAIFSTALVIALIPARAGAASPFAVSVLRPVTRNVTLPYDSIWRRVPYAIQFGVRVDRATLRYTDTRGITHFIRTGMLMPVAERPVKWARPTIPLPPDARPSQPLQLSYTSEVNDPQMRIAPMDVFVREDEGERGGLDIALLMFAGLFLALAIGNATLFASFRDSIYIWYGGVMTCAALVALRSDPDLVWRWLLPHLSMRYVVLYDATILAYSFFLVGFTRAFLTTRRILPRYDRWLLGTYGVFVLADLFLHYGTSSVQLGQTEMADALYVAMLLVAFLGGILALRAGHRAARFYVIASGGFFASLFIMDVLEYLGHSFELIVFFGIAWEGFWLIAALGDRLRRLDKAALDLALEHAAAALHDPLTGLSNRRQIEMDLRDARPPYALIHLDIDHFRLINATAGHEAGDSVLFRLALRLRSFVEPGDILARTGSDEFMFVLRNRSDAEVRALADNIIQAVSREPFSRDHQVFRLTASAGCVFVKNAAPISKLFAMADIARAKAKEEGRNNVHFAADEEAEAATHAEMQWAMRLSEAVEHGRFVLYYQPIVPLRDHRSSSMHVEILVRLVEEDGTIVDSSEFMPAADRYSLSGNIDRWVIRQALRTLRPLVANGRIGTIAMNLSGTALLDAGLAEYISGEIAYSGVRSGAVCLEITETVVLSMLDRVRSFMSSLHRQGVRFSLDDFGTGTSSLSVLRDLDVDYLKIDGSFVRNCATNETDAVVLKTICDLASALGLKTIAEYAEDYRVVEKLREIGIDYAQGFAFDKPEPLSSLFESQAALR